jgi:hypothetical protein
MGEYRIMKPARPPGVVAIALEELDEHSGSWFTGARFIPDDEPPRPFRLRFDVESEGTVLADLYQVPVVLMSKRLVGALEAGGVDNLDVYPASIIDEATGTIHDSHVAVNIIGAVSAEDAGRSVRTPGVTDRLMSASFDSLAIDEGRISKLRLFRLAENLGAIVAHDQVRHAVESAGVDGVEFIEPEQWSSL